MLNKNNKNLVCLIFTKDKNADLVKLFEGVRSDYNLEVVTHKITDTLPDKTGYLNRFVVFYADREDDFKKLQEFHDANSSRWSDRRIIIAAPFDPSRFRSQFDAQNILDVSNWDTAKKNLVKLLDECCKPISGESMKPGEKTGAYQTGQTSQMGQGIRDVK